MKASSGIVQAFSSCVLPPDEEPQPASASIAMRAAVRRTAERVPAASAGARRLEPELRALDRRAVDGGDDALGLVGRDREDREALEDLDVADGLAVEPGLLGHRVDEVGDLDALATADA